MSKFGRTQQPAAPTPVTTTGDVMHPAVPETLRKVVRPGGGTRAYPNLVRLVGERPRALVAARPEAFMHVVFADDYDPAHGSTGHDAYETVFVPWAQMGSIRVQGSAITFRWPDHAVIVEVADRSAALQTALFFLDMMPTKSGL